MPMPALGCAVLLPNPLAAPWTPRHAHAVLACTQRAAMATIIDSTAAKAG
jgi:hypothetical protein